MLFRSSAGPPSLDAKPSSSARRPDGRIGDWGGLTSNAVESWSAPGPGLVGGCIRAAGNLAGWLGSMLTLSHLFRLGIEAGQTAKVVAPSEARGQ